jgi:glutamate dehydrogenase
MVEGRLTEEDRNRLLVEMTDEVSEIVLEDNRLQTLALSIAERGGAAALPQLVRVIEVLEESGPAQPRRRRPLPRTRSCCAARRSSRG